MREIERDVAMKKRSGDVAAFQIARGAMMMMRARIQWLQELA
jgi:hypothetical protein